MYTAWPSRVEVMANRVNFYRTAAQESADSTPSVSTAPLGWAINIVMMTPRRNLHRWDGFFTQWWMSGSRVLFPNHIRSRMSLGGRDSQRCLVKETRASVAARTTVK